VSHKSGNRYTRPIQHPGNVSVTSGGLSDYFFCYPRHQLKATAIPSTSSATAMTHPTGRFRLAALPDGRGSLGGAVRGSRTTAPQ
jgi:hypothetical protein